MNCTSHDSNSNNKKQKNTLPGAAVLTLRANVATPRGPLEVEHQVDVALVEYILHNHHLGIHLQTRAKEGAKISDTFTNAGTVQ